MPTHLRAFSSGPDTPDARHASPVSVRLIPKALRNSDEHQKRRVYMNDHDLVSSGFLALAAAGLVLLGSSLLAIAFA